jgi:hypothetical protein
VGGTYLIRALGTRVVGKFKKVLNSKWSPVLLAATQSVGSFFSFVPGKIGAVSSVYLRKFSDGYLRPILLNMQNKHMDSKYRATALSAISLLVNLIMVPLGIFTGSLIDSIGIANTLGVMGILGLLIGLPIAFRLATITDAQPNTPDS